MSNVTLSAAKGLITRVPALAVICLLCAAAAAHTGIIQDVTASTDEIQLGESLKIGFRLSEPASATVTVLDSDLRTIRVYALRSLQPGAHTVAWDARDGSGHPVAPEAYAWTIEARGPSGVETWEPAGLRSRLTGQIPRYDWEESTRILSYRIPVAMRIWIRAGVNMGACMRVIAEGEPRPRGLITESWDGLDETGSISVLDQPNWGVAIFGYHLPSPCVIVSGNGPRPIPAGPTGHLSWLKPAIELSDPSWHRRRAFTLADRLRPALRIEQLDPLTFAVRLDVPDDLRPDRESILQNALANRIRLKWFVDGHCAAEDVDAVLPSLITLRPDQVPEEGTHFITANVLTALDSILVASRRIE